MPIKRTATATPPPSDAPTRSRRRVAEDAPTPVTPRTTSDDVYEEDTEVAAAPRRALKKGWAAAKQALAFDNLDYKFPEDGKKGLIKFLDDEPFAVYQQHWLNNTPKGTKKSYTCTEDSADCPLCRAGDKPSPRIVFEILGWDERKTPTTSLLFAGPGLARKIDDEAIIDESYDPPLPVLTEGYYSIKKTEVKNKVEYSIGHVKSRDLPDDWKIDEDEAAEAVATAKRIPDSAIRFDSVESLTEAADKWVKGKSDEA